MVLLNIEQKSANQLICTIAAFLALTLIPQTPYVHGTLVTIPVPGA